MKRIKCLFIFSLFVYCISQNCLNVNAEEVDASVFSYTQISHGIRINGYTGTDETVVIPSEINGQNVIEIDMISDEFNNNNLIKHMIIQAQIKVFNVFNVRHCKNLESITLPESIVSIGNTPLFCQNLSNIYIDERNPYYTSQNGVLYNKSMTELCIYPKGKNNVKIPQGVEIIRDYAFESKKLTSITIPDSVKTIGNCAFRNTDLKKIVIPNSVISIRAHSFDGCDSLVIYADPNSYAKTYADKYNISFSCINHTWDTGVITKEADATSTGEKTYSCSKCKATKTEIIPSTGTPKKGETISNSVPKKGETISNTNTSYKVTKSGTKNGTVEFSGVKSSKSTVTIPNTVTVDGIKYKVTSIAKNAFKNNKKIKKVTIGSNITKINASAFNGCKNLKTITIKSKNLKSVGKNALKGINPKAKIKVPSSKLKKYKKLLSKKGQKSTVKITK